MDDIIKTLDTINQTLNKLASTGAFTTAIGDLITYNQKFRKLARSSLEQLKSQNNYHKIVKLLGAITQILLLKHLQLNQFDIGLIQYLSKQGLDSNTILQILFIDSGPEIEALLQNKPANTQIVIQYKKRSLLQKLWDNYQTPKQEIMYMLG